jgi:hypothetical protein
MQKFLSAGMVIDCCCGNWNPNGVSDMVAVLVVMWLLKVVKCWGG